MGEYGQETRTGEGREGSEGSDVASRIRDCKVIGGLQKPPP
jgi:hypothetical protein